jgi:hypothetical protein
MHLCMSNDQGSSGNPLGLPSSTPTLPVGTQPITSTPPSPVGTQPIMLPLPPVGTQPIIITNPFPNLGSQPIVTPPKIAPGPIQIPSGIVPVVNPNVASQFFISVLSGIPGSIGPGEGIGGA